MFQLIVDQVDESFDSGVNISQESTIGSKTELMIANTRRVNDIVSASQLNVTSVPIAVCETFPSSRDCSKTGEMAGKSYETHAKNRSAVVTTADVLCEVPKHVKSPGNEQRTPKVERRTDSFAIDSAEKKVHAFPDDRFQNRASWNSMSGYSDERATMSSFDEDSKDDLTSCANRHRQCIEELFTKRKLSSEEEEEKEQIVDVIQVRHDSIPPSPDVDDVDATVAKQSANVTNRFAPS